MMLLKLIVGLFMGCVGAHALTNVGGILLQNTNWLASNGANPYYLTEDVQIPYNVSLTIGAGVQVFFNNSDREIFIKGILKVMGTLAQPVRFVGGLANDSKWMITIQSANLSQCSITNTIFTGPKRALQLSNAAAGLEQNTGTLVLQEVTLVGGTEIAANGSYSRSSTGNIPALEIRSSQIRDSTVSSMRDDGEAIRIIESLISNSTLKPAVAYDGIQLTRSILRNVSVSYQENPQGSKLEMINCTINNITAFRVSPYSHGSLRLIIRNSVVHNFSIFLRLRYDGVNLTLIESTVNNILINDPIHWLHPYYWSTWSVELNIINSILNIGYILVGSYRSSIFIDSSSLNRIDLIANASVYDRDYENSVINIRNTNFRNGSIQLKNYAGQIIYSNITLAQPPLSITRSLMVACSSIVRMTSIQQSSTTGVMTKVLQMARSSINNFNVGLRVNSSSVGSVNITNCNFENNILYNIDNDGPYHVNAAGNWWGSSDSVVIARKILDYWDDIHFGIVFTSNYSSIKLGAEKECPNYESTMYNPISRPYF